MPYFNRFDIIEAWYVWLDGHHDGKGYARNHPHYWASYGRLSTMERRLGFKPRSNLSPDTLTENGKKIYNDLCERARFCGCH